MRYHDLNTHEKGMSFVDVCISFNLFVFCVFFFCRNLLCFPITINNGGTVNAALEEGRKVEMGDDEGPGHRVSNMFESQFIFLFQILWVWHNWSTKSKVWNGIIVPR